MRSSKVAQLALWSCVALVVFRLVDTGLYTLLAPRSAALATATDLRLSSLTLLAVAFGASSVEMRLWTRAPDLRTWKLIGLWLVGVFVVVRLFGIGKVPLPRWEDRIAFGLTGVIAEELLCRGLVLGTALAIAPKGWRAIAWSAVVFSAMHLQYHGFRFDHLALAQVAWTLPAGLLLATVAVRTRSLVVVMLVHVASNAIVLLA